MLDKRRRTRNLRLLHGLTPFKGSPKSEHMVDQLCRAGASITKNLLSDIYWEKEDVPDSLVLCIEKAFRLPHGWLDGEHDYITETTQGDREDIARLLHLDLRGRKVISELLQLLSLVKQSAIDEPRT